MTICAALLGLLTLLPDEPPANVLLIIADDLSVDELAVYGRREDQPVTPTLTALARGGVRFTNAWSNPACSVTRGTIMTGRHAFRTGVGTSANDLWALQPEETTLPEALAAADPPVARALIGKWHLGNEAVGGLRAPDRAGWPHYEGALDNLFSPPWDPRVVDYENVPWVTDGILRKRRRYDTTLIVNTAARWIAAAPEPWLCVVSFHAPHTPWHVPPADLTHTPLDTQPPPTEQPRPSFKAAVEAMDTEIGRLLRGLPAPGRTLVLFVGDNGTPGQAVAAPRRRSRAKSSVYQGGVHVPLIAAGAGVPERATCDAPVHTVDLMATLLDVHGLREPAAVDSVSFLPLMRDPALPASREVLYAEQFSPGGPHLPWGRWDRAVQRGAHKLVRRLGHLDEIYDVTADPLEEHDLLAAPPSAEVLALWDGLAADLAALHAGPDEPFADDGTR